MIVTAHILFLVYMYILLLMKMMNDGIRNVCTSTWSMIFLKMKHDISKVEAWYFWRWSIDYYRFTEIITIHFLYDKLLTVSTTEVVISSSLHKLYKALHINYTIKFFKYDKIIFGKNLLYDLVCRYYDNHLLYCIMSCLYCNSLYFLCNSFSLSCCLCTSSVNDWEKKSI